MPNTKPNLKSKTGNVNHPFTERDIEAGETIYGTHPARQASVVGSSDYNAQQEYEKLRNKIDPYGIASGYHDNLTKPSGSDYNAQQKNTVGLPAVNVQTFNSGSYTNPQRTTDSSANDNSSSINTYSFLDDAQRVADWKKRNPNKNVFGLPKRTKGSFEERIKKATDEGKWNKVKRLETRQRKFEDHHKDNKPIEEE
jgi:hypothetical protein